MSDDDSRTNQQVTFRTAGVRALIYQLQALYLRTPVKLFRPTRFDYLAYVRELADRHSNISQKPYRFHTHSSLGMLFNVVRKEGWQFIPDKVIPPFLANSMTGVILYGTYLTILDRSPQPPSYIDTWKAGFLAGAAQLLAAAPVDAIYTRLNVAEILNGTHQNLWLYGAAKLKEIGLIGIFAGYSFSLIKESFGFAYYFSTFELIKTKGYNLTRSMIMLFRSVKSRVRKTFGMADELPTTRLEEQRLTKILKSSFVLLAGASAAFSLIAVQYPITKVQKIHLSRLETLDIYNANTINKPFIQLYYNSYIDTYQQVLKFKKKSKGTWFSLAYKGFVKNALATIPATSIGLLVFEIMRTRLGDNVVLE